MVKRQQIQNIADRVAQAFPQVEKIILFGSYASNTANEQSDVDMLVVMEHLGPSMTQATRIWNSVSPSFALDILVRRPSILQRQYRQLNPIARAAIDHGKILYDRRSATMDREGLQRFPMEQASKKLDYKELVN